MCRVDNIFFIFSMLDLILIIRMTVPAGRWCCAGTEDSHFISN
jgi:hypothetical protein